MKFYKAFNCPVVFKCYSLNEEFTVDANAIFDIDKGWLCKCGKWVKNTSRTHEILLMGLRDGFKREKNDKIIFSNNPSIKCICCECGNPTDREINGVYICNECYNYNYDEKYGFKSDVSTDFITALGLMILNCSIEFNPDLIICKDCVFFRDCSIHHVLMNPKELINEVRLDDFMVHP